MASPRVQVGGEPNGFVHQASVYGSDEEFLAMALPFVEDGLGLGEPVLATTTSANIRLLSDALGARAPLVNYIESIHFGPRPPERVAAFNRYWRQHVSTDSGRHVRILAEPIWTGRSEREVTAWKYMDSSVNAIFSATNVWMICPYDTRAVDPDIVDAARRTHPELVMRDAVVASAAYTDPALFHPDGDSGDLPPPRGRPATLHFDVDQLPAVRDEVSSYAGRHGVPHARAVDFVFAVNEVATNAIEHGAGHGTLRLWTEQDELLCEVTDQVTDTAGWRRLHHFAGYLPGHPIESRGRGLWLARQLCDLVEIRSDNGRTTVRMHLTMRP
ncbi:MAG: hypothetical protein GEV03_21395 [Streptosporangiales bacterium]|nr:hypothetical protein [Streptosporangiales bacterium]